MLSIAQTIAKRCDTSAHLQIDLRFAGLNGQVPCARRASLPISRPLADVRQVTLEASIRLLKSQVQGDELCE